jgi:hypothetical protein
MLTERRKKALDLSSLLPKGDTFCLQKGLTLFLIYSHFKQPASFLFCSALMIGI